MSETIKIIQPATTNFPIVQGERTVDLVSRFAKLDNEERENLLNETTSILSQCINPVETIGSTTGIMSYAKKSTDKEFIIGTENSIVSHLQYECPDKLFYPLSKDCVCHNMKLTTLVDVYNCLKGLAGEEIILPEEVSKGAKRCIDRMLELN